MEMMRQAWAGLAGPGGLAQALPMTPPANIEDLERRIADLRAVESWLRLNLSMLGSTIQGMEVQRATIATLRSFVGNLSSAGAAPAPGEATPLEIVLGLKPAPKEPGAASQPAAGPETGSSSDTAYNSTAQAAPQMWWDLLQQQFNTMASAAAASMSGMPAGQAQGAESATAAATKSATPAAAPPARKKPARKRAAAASTAAKP
jgi:hypothetical protein